MARSVSNAKVVVGSVVNDLFLSISRRGYTAGTLPASLGRRESRPTMVGKAEESAVIKEDSGASTAWAPDPITGYYRPANHAAEIDPAELREMLLNHRGRSQ
ncbi:late embryogenesis abundant protein Lea5 [Tripterygium wilfordii]|uniref:Late embryogenesis abundant protein Lea5 n=1 Tax=Tripterygium wilfordii TaxID=458696 RepID=A0A7J7E1L7_TRIWF|nr:late embryogenesis abundant protein Lea5-like [Tripterygium wilfordii]KAF5752196.1 late embryogenesis abundant protein Lea5 [Tripterygium wilfordii]